MTFTVTSNFFMLGLIDALIAGTFFGIGYLVGHRGIAKLKSDFEALKNVVDK